MTRLLTHGQFTASYLLAQATAHGGQPATVDRRPVAAAVVGGAGTLHLI